MDNDIEEFQKTLSRELIAVKDRVRNLIGDAHWGEEGRYKESVLKNVISRFLPSNLDIGTGFIITMSEGKIQRSSQIDIIIYDNTYPLLFKEGDFIITSPENVRAIVEVKTSISSAGISDIISTATKNGRLAHKSKFNGIFSFEKNGIGITRRDINYRMKQAFLDSAGVVNHLCLGENHFIKFWKSREKNAYQKDNLYSFYGIEELAFSYFISNLIESVAADKVIDKSWFLYPIRDKKGKEGNWLIDLLLYPHSLHFTRGVSD